MKAKIDFLFDSIFYSYAQILFSNRKWLGAIALLATFIKPEMGAFGLAGLLISNFIAWFLKFDLEKVKTGFYGFNGILFGLGISFYFEITIQIILLFIIFAVITFFISAVLEHYLATAFNLPGLSLPFIISLYMFLIFVSNFNTVFYKNIASFHEFEIFNSLQKEIAYYFKAFALIFFQKSVLSGILIAIGIFLFSRVLFVNSIIAYSLNYLFLTWIFPYFSDDMLLITSLNSILTSFALGGTLILVSKKTIPLIMISVIMVIIFNGFLERILLAQLLPVFVLPFNLVVLSVLYSLKFRKEQTDLVLLYFAPGSPEENFYYHNNRKYRFENFKIMFTELPVFGDWFISQGVDGSYTHKQRFKDAWDFIIKNKDDKEYENNGDYLEDYYCYNLPVVAPLNGTVVNLIDNIKDNNIGEINIKNNFGNTIVIDHGNGLFSALSHLKYKSSKVEIGSYVKKGEIIANCGNSGRSPYPHLHFQFQITDKIGDKTYSFPISHFIEQNNGSYLLKTFDFPKEKSNVSNVEVHKKIKKAFNIKFGDEFELQCKLNNTEFNEKWEVDIDINNLLFIRSSNGATAYLYQVEKVFYVTNFLGNKESALYYFYLLTLKVPYMYKEFLIWKDEYPLHLIDNSFARYVSELFLPFGQQIVADVNFGYSGKTVDDDKFYIKAETLIKGKNLFSFYKNSGTGEFVLNNEGLFCEFSFSNNKTSFFGKFINNDEVKP